MNDTTARWATACSILCILGIAVGVVGGLVVLVGSTAVGAESGVAFGALPFVVVGVGYVLLAGVSRSRTTNPYW